MSPPRLVNDFANIFTNQQRNDLEAMLLNYNDSTSTQIYVVTVSDLNGYDVSDYAIQLGNKWKIGQKNKDNGAVILIKPKIGNSRGKVFIASGYGLEVELNDAKVGRIIDEYMLPYFRQDNYYQGTVSGINVMIQLLAGQYLPDNNQEEPPVSDFCSTMIFLLIIVIIILAIKKNGGRPPMGSFRGKSDSSFGGGSFRGGGGGSFGGGGSGRSW